MGNKTYKLSYIGDKIKELLNKIDILSKNDIGLENVDNTSDINKPVSTLQKQAIEQAANEVLTEAKKYTDNELATSTSPVYSWNFQYETVGKSSTKSYDLGNGQTYTITNDANSVAQVITQISDTQDALILPDYITNKIHTTPHDLIVGIITNTPTEGHSSFSYVRLPNKLKFLGKDVFDYGCFEKIDLPNTLTHIGSSCFYTSRLLEINLPDSVEYVGSHAFYSCTRLRKVKWSSKCKTIPNGCFYNCTSLEELEIPFGVTTIESDAFNGCSNLKRVVLPTTISSIQNTAFNNISSNAVFYVEQGSYAETYAKENNVQFVYTIIDKDDYLANIQTLTIGKSYRTGQVAFVRDLSAESSYRTFEIRVCQKDHTVTNELCTAWSNGEEIFTDYWNGGLGILIESAVTDAQGDIIHETYETKDDASAKLTEAKDYTDTELEGIKYYGDFNIIPSSESYFTVNETGKIITRLSDTGKTQTELVIPYKIDGIKITNIGGNTFYGCSSLTSVTIPNSVTTIGSSAFEGCSSLTSVTIPNSVKGIGSSAFEGCSSLTSVTIPNSVKSIDINTFYGCSSLTSVTIPNSVAIINSSAFEGCSSLTSVTIPNSVAIISSSAFEGCSSLTIYCSQHSYADTFAQTNRIPVKYTEAIDGLGGFWGLDLPLIKTITLEESVTSIDILSKAEGIKLQEFTVLLFIKHLGDAVESNLRNCFMCLRTNAGGNYFGYKNVYYFFKLHNSFAFWHTKIYNKQFALTDLCAGFSNQDSDIPYGGFQGLYDATPTQYSSYTSLGLDAVDNLNVFISSSDVSKGAIFPQGSMIFLLGR